MSPHNSTAPRRHLRDDTTDPIATRNPVTGEAQPEEITQTRVGFLWSFFPDVYRYEAKLWTFDRWKRADVLNKSPYLVGMRNSTPRILSIYWFIFLFTVTCPPVWFEGTKASWCGGGGGEEPDGWRWNRALWFISGTIGNVWVAFALLAYVDTIKLATRSNLKHPYQVILAESVDTLSLIPTLFFYYYVTYGWDQRDPVSYPPRSIFLSAFILIASCGIWGIFGFVSHVSKMVRLVFFHWWRSGNREHALRVT